MVKNLSHDDWVRQQYEARYLKSEYRNVLIHSSIIEGTLRNNSGQKQFASAIQQLACSGRISASESCMFDGIRKVRNSLVHDSFKNGLIQKEIDDLRDELMGKILEAYSNSGFLNDRLFLKYKIVRVARIAFSQV